MKTYKIEFSHLALEDVKEARTWYNRQQRGLGKKLVKDVTETIDRIRQNPHFASVKFNNVRTAACKTFPYYIHYELEEEQGIIRIASIFHFSRGPYWLE